MGESGKKFVASDSLISASASGIVSSTNGGGNLFDVLRNCGSS